MARASRSRRATHARRTRGSASWKPRRTLRSCRPTERPARTSCWANEVTRLVAVTQDELYATLDLELSWSEQALPEHVRTKHVHRLHPYHGKFIPQLVEVLLDRYFTPGAHVLDPFAGSGTTLVQALESGLDAPQEAQTGEYWCYKHKRTCRPVESAVGFLRRYTLDTLARVEAFAEIRDDACTASVVQADARTVEYESIFDGVVTSPPYPGLI